MTEKAKILTVEDDISNAELLGYKLMKMGYEVIGNAPDASSAILKLQSDLPDLIIMDIMLGAGISGIELTEHIKSEYDIPVIFITALDDKETFNSAMKTQPSAYIRKPADSFSIWNAIELALNKAKTEKELRKEREQSAKLFRAIESSSSSVMITDKDGTIEYANPKYYELTGFDNKWIIGENIRILNSGLKDENVFKDLWETILKGKEWGGEFYNKKKNGELYWELASISPLKSEKGEITHFVAVKEDITLRKQQEEELKQAYENLKKSQQALVQSEKLAALGRFSSGIAHEIRNPLANIYIAVQYCQKKFEINDVMKNHFDVILKNVEIANQIIKELLQFTSDKEMELMSNDISKVLNDIEKLTSIKSREQKVKMRIEIEEGLPAVRINELKLKQAFLNFVVNSLDSVNGGGEIIIRAERDTERDGIKIIFEDNGKGIPEELIDKVIEPFFTTKSEGTGLGLSLAYQVIKSHKGEVEIASRPGEGVRIEVFIPAMKSEEINKTGY